MEDFDDPTSDYMAYLSPAILTGESHNFVTKATPKKHSVSGEVSLIGSRSEQHEVLLFGSILGLVINYGRGGYKMGKSWVFAPPPPKTG